MRAGFPDLNFSIKEQITDGDKVASRFEWTGTHHGAFLGVAATGKPVRVWGMVIDRLEPRPNQRNLHPDGHARSDDAIGCDSTARAKSKFYLNLRISCAPNSFLSYCPSITNWISFISLISVMTIACVPVRSNTVPLARTYLPTNGISS